MRIAICQQMRGRLIAAGATGGVLALWAAAWDLPLPQVQVGYRLPTGAEGWPYIALLPVRDDQDLRQGLTRSLDVAVACGVLSGDQDRDGSGAQAALDALADAVVQVLAAPLAYAVGERVLVVDRARLTALDLEHPRYQAEQLLSLTDSSGDLA